MSVFHIAALCEGIEKLSYEKNNIWVCPHRGIQSYTGDDVHRTLSFLKYLYSTAVMDEHHGGLIWPYFDNKHNAGCIGVK